MGRGGDRETLSDHRYIRVDISASAPRPTITVNNSEMSPRRSPRWSLKGLDKDALMATALVIAWPARQHEDINQRAKWLCENMVKICDAGMTRVKPGKLRGQVYWWTAEIAQQRTKCVMARRRYVRQRRLATKDSNKESELYKEYRNAKTILQNNIRDAKTRAWEELVKTLDKNPGEDPTKQTEQTA